MKIFEKCGEVSMTIDNTRMMVITHRNSEKDIDLVFLCCDCETINERFIRHRVRAHQQKSLGTSTRNEIALAW